jgi:hypothetical protein
MSVEITAEGALDAFENLRPELDELTETRRGNVNLQRAAIAAAATGGRVRAPEMRARFAELPGSVFDIGHVDRLEPAALALWHAVVESKRAAVGASGGFIDPALAEVAAALKSRMFQVIEYHLGDVREVRNELDAIRDGTGYIDQATDLSRLARLYDEYGLALAGDTRHYRAEDGPQADQVSRAIVRELGEGQHDNAAIWSDYVSRAWTLLADTYDEVSAAGRFVFRHEGGESMFPSLVTISRARPSRSPGDEAPDAPDGELPEGNGADAQRR